jgi:transcriptional regulator with XRE-family HTH domain
MNECMPLGIKARRPLLRSGRRSALPTLGKRIRTWRLVRALTQADLAAAAGVTQSAESLWENDRTEPTLRHLAAIAEALKISLEQFWGPLPELEAA